jgi:hypothetical protein
MKLVKSLEVLLRGVRARALKLGLLWRKPKTRGNTHNTRGALFPADRRPHLFSLSLSLKLSIYSKWRRPFANNIILLLLPTAALLLLALVYMCEQINAHMTHPSHRIARAAHKNTKRGADETAAAREGQIGGSTRGQAGGFCFCFYPRLGPRVARAADCVRDSQNVPRPPSLCRHLMQTELSFEPFKFIATSRSSSLIGTC